MEELWLPSVLQEIRKCILDFSCYTRFLNILIMILPKFARVIQARDVVAVLVEPIQGEGGIVVPEKGYLSKLGNYVTRPILC